MSPNPVTRKRSFNHFWRLGVVLAAAGLLLLLQTASVLAAGIKMAPTVQATGRSVEAVALDKLCVDGTVIDHQERPMQGWTVTATYMGDEGSYAPMTNVSNKNGRFHFDLPATGRWAFAVDVPESWEPITDPIFEVNVTYGNTESCVQIRFKLEQLIEVIVIKIDDKHQPLAGWPVTAIPGDDNPFAEPVTEVTDEEGIARFYLPPGQWTFVEGEPEGVDWWRAISPPDGEQTIVVTAPGPHTIRFKNIIHKGRGCIEVVKRDVPPNGSASFGLEGWQVWVERMDGLIAAAGQTNAFGGIVFNDLPFGPYIVREEQLAGWVPASPTAYQVVLTPDDEGCQLIEFYNRQIENGFCIEGYKLDHHDGVGIPGWGIEAKPDEEGGFTPDAVLTDGKGYYRIDLPLNDYRIPGSTYTVCEEEREGWTPASQTCYSVMVPWQEGACVQVPDFVNAQTRRDGKPEVDKPDPGKPDKPHGGMCSAQHVVRRGDTLSKLARYYHTSVQALVRANHIRNPNRIYVGQTLCIP